MKPLIFSIFIFFFIFCSTRLSFAVCERLPIPFTNQYGTWPVQGNLCYPTNAAALSACQSAQLSSQYPCQLVQCAPGSCFNLSVTQISSFYVTYAAGGGVRPLGIYWIDPAGIGDTDGDGIPDNQDPCPSIAGNCPNDDCAQAYEQKSMECGAPPVNWDNATCNGVCPACIDEYNSKKQECSNPWPDKSTPEPCDYLCDCSKAISEAEQSCPFGFKMVTGGLDPCAYACLSCSELYVHCIDQCGSNDNVSVMQCNDSNGVVTDYICRCKDQDTCSGFRDACERACSTPECGGVLNMRCDESGGKITYSKCECSGCGKTPDPPDPEPSDKDGDGIPDSKDPDDDGDGIPDTDEPDGGSGNNDIIFWLKAIKGDTGTLVSQGEDQTAWLSSIKHGIDVSNDIAKQGHAAVVSAVTDVKKSVVDVKNSVDAVGSKVDVSNNIAQQGYSSVVSAISDLKGSVDSLGEGLANVKIETAEGSGPYDDITDEGYGNPPTPADLPTAQDTKDAIGPFTPKDEGTWRDDVASSLEALDPPFEDPTCSVEFTVPFSLPYLGGRSYNMDFCPFSSGLASLGTVLVFLAAVRELYLFS